MFGQMFGHFTQTCSELLLFKRGYKYVEEYTVNIYCLQCTYVNMYIVNVRVHCTYMNVFTAIQK